MLQGTLLHPACGKGSQNCTVNAGGIKCETCAGWPSVEEKNTSKGIDMVLIGEPSQGTLT